MTGDDYCTVKVFNYPCVVKSAPCLSMTGHSSFVENVKFYSDGKNIASVGGNDCALMLWRLDRVVSPTVNKGLFPSTGNIVEHFA